MQPTKLLNDDPEVFTNYMRCVYLGDVSPLLKGQNWGEKGSQVHFQALIMIFVLADRLCDLLTANIVTAEIIDFSGRMGMLPDSTATNLVYASTASTNPLRALMRDYCVYEAGIVQFAGEMSSKSHTELFPDVVVEHVKIKSKSLESMTTTTVKTAFDVAVSTIEKCKYHQHDENFPSCSSIIRRCFVHLAPDL